MEVNTEVKIYESFDEMDLPVNLLRGIYSYGYEKPSKIQSLAIVPIKEGRDIIAQSSSGTGKSCSFIVGSMCRIDITLNKPQVFILVPTQELAKQIYNVAKAIGNYMPISCYCAIGGTPIRDDIKAIDI